MAEDKPKIIHTLIISGKVNDVKEQLSIMTKQFPNATIKEVCDAYGLKELVLK